MTRSAPSICSASSSSSATRSNPDSSVAPTAARPPARPPAAPDALELGHVDAVVLQVHLGQPLQPPAQQLDLRRRSRPSAGRTRRPRRGTGGHVAGHDQLDRPQPLQRVQRPQRAEAAVGGGRAADARRSPAGRPASSAAAISSPVPWVAAAIGSLPSGPPTRSSPEARAISITATPRDSRHSASTGSPSGPVTTVERFGPPSASSVPSPPSASGTSVQSPPRSAPRAPPPPATSAAVAVPRNLSGAATTRIRQWCTFDARRAGASVLQPSDVPRPHRAGAPRVPAHVADRPVVDGVQPGAAVVPLATATSSWPGAARAAWCRASAPLVAGTATIWIAAAMSDGRPGGGAGAGRSRPRGSGSQLLDLDPDDYRLAYDVVCNATLWFAHHGLWDLAREPAFDRQWAEAWAAYERVNAAFADAVAATAPADAAVLVQDYHLAPRRRACCAERRPDLRTVHFSHTPFATPDWFGVLPARRAARAARGHGRPPRLRLPHPALGRRRSTRAASRCSAGEPPTFVSPLGRRPRRHRRGGRVRRRATAALAELDAAVGDRKLIARVDRIELSKNLLRGFHAYDELLDDPARVAGPGGVRARSSTRRGRACEAYDRVPARGRAAGGGHQPAVGDADWTPVLYDDSDDFPRSVAALRRADVLLVNPIRDGLNLVAKEGVLVNERSGALMLSTEAGIAARARRHRDRASTRSTSPTPPTRCTSALAMSADERAIHAAALARGRLGSRTPADWLADQIAAADATRAGRQACAQPRDASRCQGRPTSVDAGPRATRAVPGRTSTTTSAASISSAGVSGPATATRTMCDALRWPAGRAPRTPAGRRRRRRRTSRPAASAAAAQLDQRAALVGVERRVQLDRHLRRSARRGRIGPLGRRPSLAPRAASSGWVR